MATTLDVRVDNSQALRKLDEIANRVTRLAEQFEGAFNRSRQAALALGATLSGLGAATARFADEISDIAAANDTTTASILALSTALGQSGGRADTVGRLFATLGSNIEEANSGNEKTVATFNRLGVTLQDLGTLSASEIKNRLIKNLAEIKDPAQQSALAMQMFGKAALGVNWQEMAGRVEENTKKYEQFAPALDTAGAAFDRMALIVGDLKVAFAVAFEPIFRTIANLNLQVPDLVKGLNYMAVAMAALTSAAVLGGLAKAVDLLRVMAVVVSKNPLIAIGAALLSLGAGAATYLGLTREQEQAQKKVTEAVNNTSAATTKVVRDQSGITDKYQKQLDSLTKIRQTLDANFASARDRLDIEQRSLGLSEAQRRVEEQTGQIQQQTEQALLSLKQANDALSRDAQQRNKNAYEDERKAIIDNGERQKQYFRDRILALSQQRMVIQDLVKAEGLFGDLTERRIRAAQESTAATNTPRQQIDAESRLNTILQIRQALIGNIARVAESEQAILLDVINQEIFFLSMLGKANENYVGALRERLKLNVEEGRISQETADTIVTSTENQIRAIQRGNDLLKQQLQVNYNLQQQFIVGWTAAQVAFVKEAENAAATAQQLFTNAMQGIENVIVNTLSGGRSGFRDFLAGIAKDILRSNVRKLLAQLFGSTTPGGNFLGTIFDFFVPGRALGGPVQGNTPYIVGERGPELFVPNAGGGQIIPTNKLDRLSGGGQSITQVTYNINAVDASSFRTLVASDPEFIFAVTEQGRRRLPNSRR